MLSNFEKLGDIDAESIVKATHSSADLAMAMEMAGFNAGGLAAALEGVASGTIKEEQVTNSLLAGLSVLNQVDSIRAEAYDSIDTYDKGRSVTEYGKFTGNLAKTIQYNLRNGYMFDETLQNAWGELFGEDRVYELQ
jgi:membrane protease subunit (stomatin/prohibitin family)